MVASRAMSRTHAGRFTPKSGGDATTTTTTTATTTAASRASRKQRVSNTSANQTDIRDFVERRPAKRLKLSPSSDQQLLPAAQPKSFKTEAKLPNKVTATQQPQSRQLKVPNGTQKLLGVQLDEISSRDTTPGVVTEPDGLSGPKPSGNDKRSLRSQGGASRLKSELAIYFPNYEDIINDAPKTPEFLEIDTQIYILDEPLKSLKQSTSGNTSLRTPSKSTRAEEGYTTPRNHTNKAASRSPTQNRRQSTSATFNGAQVIDFSAISRNSNLTTTDPLSDDVFFKPHRRAERKEKQLRNIEKERAMHEKVQLERLLEDLLGHDWLRVMGITGITDSEKKDWETKREYFIGEVRALVDKFRIWKEEEKRLKLEKEAALHAKREEEEEAEAEAEGSDEESGGADEEESEDEAQENEDPNSSDIDAEAARQLLEEASARPKFKLVVRKAPSPPRPLTSFYDKPHLRAAAMGRLRHGRTITAFGHPIPDMHERDFAPPAEYVTPDSLRTNARRRRIMKRSRSSKG